MTNQERAYPGGLSDDDIQAAIKHVKNGLHSLEQALEALKGGPVAQSGPTPPPPGPIPPN